VDANGSGFATNDVLDVQVSCLLYEEPVAALLPDAFVADDGILDGSLTTMGSATSLAYRWKSSADHDFVFTNNGTLDPEGVTVHTDKFDDLLFLEGSLFFADSLLYEDPEEVVVVTTMTLGVADFSHTSTASGTTSVFNEDYAYVKRLGSGNKTGASPDNAAETIQAGISYAKANGKSRVAIAQGTYVIDIDNAPITMVGGVSLYGGYSASTWTYDPDTYRTEIRAQGAGIITGVTPVIPLATIEAGSDVASDTSIRGLHVYSPIISNNAATTALLIKGGKVTVQNNTFISSSQGDGGWSGLTITSGSTSLVKKNTIVAYDGPLASNVYDTPVGTGLAIYGANPVIESNRIRGGGIIGRGILIYNSHPNILNNMILGCEDKATVQSCLGVMYMGQHDDTVPYADTAGGKLYNNTIIGGISSNGGESIAVYTMGQSSSPEIVNNILYSQNAYGGNTVNEKTACINSDSISPGALPAAIYNNACIRSPDGCFHHFWTKEDTKWYEDFAIWQVDALIWIYNEIIVDIAGAPGSWATEWLVGAFPDIHLDYMEEKGFTEVCRTATGSNADDIYLQFVSQYEDAMEFIGLNLEWLPSGGNVDITAPNFFVDIDGLDNDLSTMEDNDWRLTGSAGAELIEGGKCTAPDNYKDMDGGASRTPGWSAASGCFEETGYSMGAYEFTY